MTEQTFGEFLKQVREKRGAAKRDAAQACGVGDMTYERWEEDDLRPGLEHIGLIARWAEVPIPRVIEMTRARRRRRR